MGTVPWWPAERAGVTLHHAVVRVIADTHRHAGHADILRELIDGAVGMTPGNTSMPPGDRERWQAHHARLDRPPARRPTPSDGGRGRSRWAGRGVSRVSGRGCGGSRGGTGDGGVGVRPATSEVRSCVSSPIGLSEGCREALHHLKETREINTVILRFSPSSAARAPDVPDLEVELEGNLTHEELVQALPTGEARLLVHELSFAARDGARRHEQLLILWMPADAAAQEGLYTDGYTALKEYLVDVPVHLTARRADQLAYRRLVALAG